MDFLFQKSLNDVVRALRQVPDNQSLSQESFILAKALHDVQKEVESRDRSVKAVALEKLLFLHIRGQSSSSKSSDEDFKPSHQPMIVKTAFQQIGAGRTRSREHLVDDVSSANRFMDGDSSCPSDSSRETGGLSWASFPCVEVMSSQSFNLKVIGYLAAIHCLPDASPDLTLLCTHSLRKDLTSSCPHHSSLALTLLASPVSTASPNLLPDLLPDLTAILSGSRALPRRKAMVAFLRAARPPRASEESPMLPPPAVLTHLAERLQDTDPAVVAAAGAVACELVLHERTALGQDGHKQGENSIQGRPASAYLPLAPDLFPLLNPGASPMLLIKVVKIFASLAAKEPRVAKKIVTPLIALMQPPGTRSGGGSDPPSTASSSSRPVPRSLMLECIRAVARTPALRQVDSLRQLAVAGAADMAGALDCNLKALGLASLEEMLGGGEWEEGEGEGVQAREGEVGAGGARKDVGIVAAGGSDSTAQGLGEAAGLVRSGPRADVLRHKAVIVAALDNPDPAIRASALRLVTALVASHSLKPTVSILLQRMVAPSFSPGAAPGLEGSTQAAASAASSFTPELVAAVLQMAAWRRFSRVADFDWYLDVLVDMCYAVTGGNQGVVEGSWEWLGEEIGRQMLDIGLNAQLFADRGGGEKVWRGARNAMDEETGGNTGIPSNTMISSTDPDSSGLNRAGASLSDEHGSLPAPLHVHSLVSSVLHRAERLVNDSAVIAASDAARVVGGHHCAAAAAFLVGELCLVAPLRSSPEDVLSALLLQPCMHRLPAAAVAVFLQAACKLLLHLISSQSHRRLPDTLPHAGIRDNEKGDGSRSINRERVKEIASYLQRFLSAGQDGEVAARARVAVGLCDLLMSQGDGTEGEHGGTEKWSGGGGVSRTGAGVSTALQVEGLMDGFSKVFVSGRCTHSTSEAVVGLTGDWRRGGARGRGRPGRPKAGQPPVCKKWVIPVAVQRRVGEELVRMMREGSRDAEGEGGREGEGERGSCITPQPADSQLEGDGGVAAEKGRVGRSFESQWSSAQWERGIEFVHPSFGRSSASSAPPSGASQHPRGSAGDLMGSGSASASVLGAASNGGPRGKAGGESSVVLETEEWRRRNEVFYLGGAGRESWSRGSEPTAPVSSSCSPASSSAPSSVRGTLGLSASVRGSADATAPAVLAAGSGTDGGNSTYALSAAVLAAAASGGDFPAVVGDWGESEAVGGGGQNGKGERAATTRQSVHRLEDVL